VSEQLTTAAVWEEIGRNNFAVLGMVSARDQARTVGIVYVVDDRKLYLGAGRDQWKVEHVSQNGDVSMTIPIAKRVPLMPWIKIPPATITFSGTARVLEQHQLGQELFEKLHRHDADRSEWRAIEVTPQRHFVTYGIGVSLMTMRHPDQARARVPVE
jgi:hypothetical protein